jgi:hypothetical protein
MITGINANCKADEKHFCKKDLRELTSFIIILYR